MQVATQELSWNALGPFLVEWPLSGVTMSILQQPTFSPDQPSVDQAQALRGISVNQGPTKACGFVSGSGAGNKVSPKWIAGVPLELVQMRLSMISKIRH